MAEFVVPGELICRYHENLICGDGVYLYEGNIRSKAIGTVIKENNINGKSSISVKTAESTKTPYVDAIVLARVTGITPTLIRAEIICVDGNILKHTYKGILRKEAIRDKKRDEAEPSKSVGLADIIRATILNITGSKSEGGFSYLLSTAEPQCGVIYAVNPYNRNPLIPVTDTLMYCLKTRKTFSRKVAKVDLEFISTLINI